MQPAIFLDRDGVIVENRPDYILSYSHVEYLPQAVEALITIRDLPYKIVIITNQSAVGRGLLPLEMAQQINQRIIDHLRSKGARIDASYLCPHSPADYCDCRKPKPGMLLQASEELDIDLGNSFMIGDALTDIQAGLNAGVGNPALVLTGRGADQIAREQVRSMPSFPVYADLRTAVYDLLMVTGPH
ncbi:MAG: HAD family hydrolase [Gammaproteobacteria bacterium]|nr:HAD family hydrolase [candidate division Zixibacteria bacterium]NIR93299.1 HAD family hydrolase [Gammaproteobacteria bacterium]NIT55248.1 HAD family hydrolase [Fodinibius sp.]NIR64347.1 HAD family hydrolase [candidate division Zixibacteria bacterium]NIS44715.1 HAD family hydrolase [candidate division Zixibacteria bacterium]